MQKVKIELIPYTALTILSFMKEFNLDNHPQLKSLKECVAEFETQLYKHMTREQIQDATAENAVNKLLGKSP